MIRYAVFTFLFLTACIAHAELPPSEATKAANQAAVNQLPQDVEDEDFVRRGFIGTLDDSLIRAADGHTVWDLDAYAWVKGAAPESVHPSLWRQAQMLAVHGLFRLTDGLYQVRSLDGSNMMIVEGQSGFIVLDTLTNEENARAAIGLVRKHLGNKPVVAVIYSHSHVDHFGGIRGVVDEADVNAGRVRIYAPEHFVAHTIGESVIAGPAMGRRANFQIGEGVAIGPLGMMTAGLGAGRSLGTVGFIPPTDEITPANSDIVIDGVRFQFQLTPGSEAPAEMHAFIPELRALWLAENANATMHNVLTPRGALVRDAKAWADYLTEALLRFGAATEVAFGSHHWPRYGNDRVIDFLASQRDMYKYLHDQSVRLMNKGFTGEEIAERIELPDALARRWFNRGYYGTVRFNSKAVYQRYMGWYDGNPVHLNSLPHEQSAARYVALMGGADKVLGEGERAYNAGDYRWAAEILNHLVFAAPDNQQARELLAQCEEQMAYQAESGTWRSMYLLAAKELRGAPPAGASMVASTDFMKNTPSNLIFDMLATRVNPQTANLQRIDFVFPERNEHIAVSIENGVLVHAPLRLLTPPDSTLTLPRAAFVAAVLAPAPPASTLPENDAAVLQRFRASFDGPDPAFPIVTP
jgi:alkyl sulfatase BDS1-like metallo-beta-lactamase superfamily hydrolase